MNEGKAPNWWVYVLNVVSGLICVLLSAVVLAYPGLDILTLVLILAAAILVVGLARIIVGVFAEYLSTRLRAISVGGGLLEIIATITNVIYPQYLTQTLIQLLSVALLVRGTASAAIGRYARTLPSLLRGLLVVVGLFSIALSVTAFVSIPLGFLTSVYTLSIGYLSNGIVEIILGITGLKRTQRGDHWTK